MKFAVCLLCLFMAMVCIKAFPNNDNEGAESALSMESGIPTDLLQLEGDPGVLLDEPQADLRRERRHKKWKKKGYRHGGGGYGGGGYGGGGTYIVNQYYDDGFSGGYGGGHGHKGSRYPGGGHYQGHYGGGYGGSQYGGHGNYGGSHYGW